MRNGTITRERKVRIPRSLQGVLWSAGVSHLDMDKDKEYIIHQVLMYGTLAQIQWLLRVYGVKMVQEVFLSHPVKVYTPQALYFIKNIILGLKNTRVDAKQYVSTFPRSAH